MPLMDVTYPQGALSPDARDALIEALTAAILRAERAPDTEFFRNVTWVYAHELPAANVYVGGRPAQPAVFRVEAKVPQGALSDRRKQELVETATAAVVEHSELTPEQSLRVFVLVNEVPEGNWGAAGNVIQFEQLRAAAAAQREQAAATSA